MYPTCSGYIHTGVCAVKVVINHVSKPVGFCFPHKAVSPLVENRGYVGQGGKVREHIRIDSRSDPVAGDREFHSVPVAGLAVHTLEGFLRDLVVVPVPRDTRERRVKLPKNIRISRDL